MRFQARYRRGCPGLLAGGAAPLHQASAASSPSAFTLVEVLVGIVVLGLAAAVAATSLQSAASMVGENTLHGEAIALAQEAMEDLRAQPYEAMTSGGRVSESGVISVRWDVRANDPEQGMKMVVVSSSWTWKGEPRSYVLRTAYSKITTR